MRLSTLCLLGLLAGCQRNEAPAAAASAPVIAAPSTHRGNGFKPIGGIEGENPNYDKQRTPEKIIAALGIQKGQRVADIGAGRGYLSVRLIEAVGPTGHVVATDVDEDAIATLRERLGTRPELTIRSAQPDDPGLEAGAYDLVLMSEVDHFLEDRVAFLSKVKPALAPGGRLAVTHTFALRKPLEAAAEQAGFKVVTDYTGLSDHYLLIFEPVTAR
jgi:2-polyprenyl-3-methyl-5-hydroxy-6-metoxy-1,4-benzoquinol methylase